MKTTTVTDFRANLKEHLAEVKRDHDILVISGPKKNSFVVMTLEHFNSLDETNYLMSTQANAQRLLESIAEHKAGVIAKSFEFKDGLNIEFVAQKKVRKKK